MEYRYSVYNAKGQLLNGTLEAENEEICRRIIAQRGLYCVSVKPASLASRSLSLSKPRLKLKEVAVFCRQMAAMLSSGLSVIKCLDILHTQAIPKRKPIIKTVYDTVQRGQSLSAALRAQQGAFPDLMINMVETGETSGSLESVMLRLAELYEKEIKTNSKAKSAMMYPMILGIITVLVVTVLMAFVMPNFIKMFEDAHAELPLPTKIMVGISNSITQYWYVYIMVISALTILWLQFIRSAEGRMHWDRWKTRMPVVGKLLITIISGRFARTLSSMVQSGVPMLRSLEVTARVLGNKHLETKMLAAKEEIRRGASLSAALRKTEEFPTMLLSMITVGEESGNLDDVLHKTALVYDDQADAAVTRLVGLLEPLMIVVMALIVGFVVVSIILPMYGMMQVVQG